MKKIEEEYDWDLEIAGKTRLLDFNLQETWHYRDLLWILVKRDFVSFYKQTILGPLWFFVQPLFMTIVFTVVFGGIAKVETDGLPGFLFYLAGITAWNYFADCLTKTSTVFKDNAQLFGKVYFPRIILPLSIVFSNLVRFAVQLILLLIAMVYFGFQGTFTPVLSWGLLLFPYLVLLMAFLGLGLGLIITALTTKYRDLTFLITFGVQLMMYATAVIYPLNSAPDQYRWLIEVNPMTFIVEAFRFAVLGKGFLTLGSMLYASLFTFACLVFGFLIFNKTERSFVDTI